MIDGCRDLPDPRDFIAEDILGANIEEVTIKKSVNLLNVYANNQGPTNACTAFALANLIAMAWRFEHNKSSNIPDVNAARMWLKQFEYPGTASEARGDYLQSALKAIKRTPPQMLIDGKWQEVQIESYQRVRRSNLKKWLSLGIPIYTGVILRRPTVISGKLNMDGDIIGGHAICLIGYNEDGDYIMLNSWGDKWGKQGTCLIPGDKINQLFTSYIINF